MNAPTLKVERNKPGREAPAVAFDGKFLLTRIGIGLREQRCPSCNSVVYTRRHSRCGVCERELPASFLFTPAEAEKLEALIRAERQQHQAWLTKYAGNTR
jgi:hypothetical protein